MCGVLKGEVLSLHEGEISWEMSGGGNIAADVGSEQNTRATGTALAFTTTQEQEKNLIAHLFTSSPLPSPLSPVRALPQLTL
jgi:hypothetical protein